MMTSKLKEAREKAGYTIEEIASILKIRKQYIISLEDEKFQDIPGQVYVEGYTKMYYEFLNLELPQVKSISIQKPRLIGSDSVKINKKYVIIPAIIMLIVVIWLYSILKVSEEKITEEDFIQNKIDSHGNNQEAFD